MSKIILSNIGDLTNTTTSAAAINANNAAIQIAFDKTLSRDGTQPNQMNSNLDMDSNRIINLPVGVNPDEPVTVGTFNAAVIGHGNIPIGGNPNQVLAKTTSTDYDTHWSNSVTSVGLALPADFAVSNSPVTTSGTLTGAWATLPTGTGAMVRATNPTFPTNIATGTINNVVIAAPASTASLTIGSGKAVSLASSLTLAGTDSTTITFQGTDTYVGRTTTDTLTHKTLDSATNTLTGTQSGLTAGGVTTNANLTGVITSVGNATSIASQTGTGTKFVTDTSPTLVTPNIGTPSAGVLTNCTGTAAGLTAGNVTTNANLTGAITSTGNASLLGSFTSASLKTALTDETGSGAAVFATSPALVTPTGIVKGDVGLGNVDNTSDVTKWAATKTLTNTTYDTAGTGNSFSINGVAATANTGTGSVVRATSPTLVTPTLGAATATTINGASIDNLAWTTYTPTVTAQTGTPTTTTATGRYKQIGKTLFLNVLVTITTVGTATGAVNASLPFTAVTATNSFIGSALEQSTTGKSSGCYVFQGSTVVSSKQTDASTWWVNGYILAMSVTYEIP